MNDTSAGMEKLYLSMLLALAPSERLKMACRMYDTAKKLVIAGILRENPNLDLSRLREEFFLRMYGSEFTAVERENIIHHLLSVTQS